MAHKELLLSWLNDAYSMEQNLVQTLENHANDAKDHPQMQSKIQQHLEVTRRHAELVKGEIERLGGSVSTIKSAIGNITGFFQGMSTGAAEDELVKNALGDYAAEHFEMASYKALIVAAREFGDQQLVSTCEQILRDEEDMARWLDQNLPMAVTEHYRKKAGEHRAA